MPTTTAYAHTLYTIAPPGKFFLNTALYGNSLLAIADGIILLPQGYLCKAEILGQISARVLLFGDDRSPYLECIRNYMISYDKSGRRTHETACTAICTAVDIGR